VWFPGAGAAPAGTAPGGADRAPDEVKDIRTGTQEPADAATWQPPADDLHPRVEGKETQP
jgi:histidyl-tRNA synthetase